MDDAVSQSAADARSLDERRWQAEQEFRRRELDIQEADQRIREEDLRLRTADARTAHWRSPLIVTIAAATLAALGNAAVAFYNADKDRRIEENKEESERILAAIRVDSPDKAAVNLSFLIESGLIRDSGTVGALKLYLKGRKPGRGASLASADSHFAFEDAPGATAETTKTVSGVLSPYIAHLTQIGFTPDLPKVSIRIDRKSDNPSYYLPDDQVIVLSTAGAKDDMFPIAEYTIHALNLDKPNDLAGRRLEVEYGLRDYLIASYLKDPNLGLRYKQLFGVEAPSLQLLRPTAFTSITGATDAHDAGQVWASAFWALRTQIGATRLDPVLVRAWRATPSSTPASRYPAAFLAALRLTAAQDLTPQERATLEQVLATRRFPRA